MLLQTNTCYRMMTRKRRPRSLRELKAVEPSDKTCDKHEDEESAVVMREAAESASRILALRRRCASCMVRRRIAVAGSQS